MSSGNKDKSGKDGAEKALAGKDGSEKSEKAMGGKEDAEKAIGGKDNGEKGANGVQKTPSLKEKSNSGNNKRKDGGAIERVKEEGGIHISVYVDVMCTTRVESLRQYGRTFTVEELVTHVSRQLGFTSLSVFLFGLVTPDLKIWLPPNEQVECSEDRPVYLTFRQRFYVPQDRAVQLTQNDKAAFHYFFLQCQDDFLNDRIPYKEGNQSSDLLLGLVVVGIVRYGKEHLNNFDAVKKLKSKPFLPTRLKNEFSGFLNKKRLNVVLKPHIEEMYNGLDNVDMSVVHLKMRYFYDGLLQYAPDYGSELFFTTSDTMLCVDPHQDGVVCKKTSKEKSSRFENIARMSELVEVSVGSDAPNCVVSLNRKTNIPEIVWFRTRREALSFVACLDGYYRLTEQFHHHLCDDVKAPHFNDIRKKLRCHGPVSREWAGKRLLERHRVQPEVNYLLKMKQTQIDSYSLLYVNPAGDVISLPVIQLPDARYQVVLDNEPIFPSMSDLISHYKSAPNGRLHLQAGVPVSQPLDPCLYLCLSPTLSRPTEPVNTNQHATVSLLSAVNTSQQIAKGKYSLLHKGSFQKGSKEITVAVKEVVECTEPPGRSSPLQAFTSSLHKMSFWSHPSLVTVHALCLERPFRALLDYAPLGSLDQLLRSATDLCTYDLLTATKQIAEGLSYLQEEQAGSHGLGAVHGNLRCRNILVVKREHHDGLRVKIADPGLVEMYNSLPLDHPDNVDRLPWVAPECYDNLRSATMYSDRYALGMTILEIFMKAERAFPPYLSYLQIMDHVRQGRKMPQLRIAKLDKIYGVIEECRKLDPGSRIPPKEVVRTVLSVMFQADPFIKGLMSIESVAVSGLGDYYYSCVDWLDHQVEPSPVPHLPAQVNHVTPQGAARMLPAVPISITNPTSNFIVPSSLDTHDFKQTLGEGHFGQVYKAWHRQWGVVAIKSIKPDVYHNNRREFEEESKIMLSVRHRNVVEIRGICYDCDEDHPMLIVMEFADCGNLASFLTRPPRPHPSQLLYYCCEIAEGMVFLSGRQIIHRDLATRNVLVFNENVVKIGDFGMAKVLRDKDYYHSDSKKGIPIHWCAPEAMAKFKFTTKGDVWSYGVTVWEIFSYAKKPILCKDYKDMYTVLHRGERLRKPADCPDTVYRLMLRCWEFDDEKRPDFKAIKDKLSDIHV